MARTSKKHLKLTILLVLPSCILFSQAKTGMENYNYLSRGNDYQWMPVMHYQAAKGWYAELRYNYEEKNTFSVFGGRTFLTGKMIEVDLTPMIGFSAGDFKGISVAGNIGLEYKKWFFSSQSQYSRSVENKENSFFFTWTEMGYTIFPIFYAGVAGQFTLYNRGSDWQPGLLAGFSFGDLTVPVYFFKPFQAGYNVIIGINYEYQLKKKKKQAKGMYLE